MYQLPKLEEVLLRNNSILACENLLPRSDELFGVFGPSCRGGWLDSEAALSLTRPERDSSLTPRCRHLRAGRVAAAGLLPQAEAPRSPRQPRHSGGQRGGPVGRAAALRHRPAALNRTGCLHLCFVFLNVWMHVCLCVNHRCTSLFVSLTTNNKCMFKHWDEPGPNQTRSHRTRPDHTGPDLITPNQT